VSSIERYLLQGETQRFTPNFTRSPSCKSPLKFPIVPPCSLIGNSERKWLWCTHTVRYSCGYCFTHHVRIGKGAITSLTPVATYAMNLFYIRMVFLSIERGARNALRFWKLREEHLADVGPQSALAFIIVN
jgi:hypothetical protein